VTNDNGNSLDYLEVTSNPSTNEQWNLIRLIDINGDGLLDRVLTKESAPYDRYRVQLNTGSGFGPLTDWTFGPGQDTSQKWNSGAYITNGATVVDLVDINGDGLPDRVMRSTNSTYTSLKVQLNQGPFPDLLNKVDNGVGGKVTVTYLPSTKYDNADRVWTNSPWAEGARPHQSVIF
jgi:hypothetical protein